MVVYQTSYVTITHCTETDAILIAWLKKPGTHAFTAAYLAGLEYIKSHPYIKLYCTDLTQSGGFDIEQESWLNSEYYSQVYKVVRDDIYAAVVFSEEHFKALISNYHATPYTSSNNFIHFNYFTDQQEGLTWLKDISKGQQAAILQPIGLCQN